MTPAARRAARDMALDLMRPTGNSERDHRVELRTQALCDVVCERTKADAVHGRAAVGRGATLEQALEALREEVAEVEEGAGWLASGLPGHTAEELRDHLRYECVQVAALAVAMIERLDLGEWDAAPGAACCELCGVPLGDGGDTATHCENCAEALAAVTR